MTKTWIFLALLLVSLDAGANEAGPARAALERFSQDLQGLHCRFEQVIVSPEGEVIESGSGELWVSRPGRFRWFYEGDFPELIVADGRNLWMYDEALQQVTVRKQSQMAEDTPLTLLTSLEGLDEQFNVTEMGNTGEMDLLNLETRGGEAEFERVILGLDDDRIVLMAMEDAFGMRTEIRFGDMQRNPELPLSLFEFSPPADVDVVGDIDPDQP